MIYIITVDTPSTRSILEYSGKTGKICLFDVHYPGKDLKGQTLHRLPSAPDMEKAIIIEGFPWSPGALEGQDHKWICPRA